MGNKLDFTKIGWKVVKKL